MTDSGEGLRIPPLEYVKMAESTVTGRHKDKPERIREAMDDLQLAIDGCQLQLQRDAPSEQFPRSIAALARASSVFLRKTVLGDRGDNATRLLDDEVCETLGLKFHRLVKIPQDRTPMEISISIGRGSIDLTKKDAETLLPEYTLHVPVGPQKLGIRVEWPLPGIATWVAEPHDQHIGRIRVEDLFALCSEPTQSCGDWLSQQLVLFDNKGITLGDVIATIANTEGAHSGGGGRVKSSRREAPQKLASRQRLNILNNIKLGPLKINHIVVVETALYLYERIMQHRVTQGEIKGYYMPSIVVESDVPDNRSLRKQGVVGFEGGIIFSLGGQEQTVFHSVRAPK